MCYICNCPKKIACSVTSINKDAKIILIILLIFINVSFVSESLQTYLSSHGNVVRCNVKAQPIIPITNVICIIII